MVCVLGSFGGYGSFAHLHARFVGLWFVFLGDSFIYPLYTTYISTILVY